MFQFCLGLFHDICFDLLKTASRHSSVKSTLTGSVLFCWAYQTPDCLSTAFYIDCGTGPRENNFIVWHVRWYPNIRLCLFSQGAECFDYSKAFNILVTGSLDHLVRIWNPYVVARPITILQGHSTGICDIVINETFGQIITYSKDVVSSPTNILFTQCCLTDKNFRTERS